MALKGKIQKDIIAGNKYTVRVGVKEIICTTVSAIEEAIQTIDPPDGTTASGGRTEVSEFTIAVPAHHQIDMVYMNEWFAACQDPVLPTAYRMVTVKGSSSSGNINRIDTCFGCHITGRQSAEYLMEDGGSSMTVVEFTIRADRVMHI